MSQSPTIDRLFDSTTGLVHNCVGYYECQDKKLYDEAVRMTLFKLRPLLEAELNGLHLSVESESRQTRRAEGDLRTIADILNSYRTESP